MNYRIIESSIAGKLSASETYTLFCLLSKSDYNTGYSHIKQETLKDIIGLKKIDTLQSHLKKFYELKLVSKKTNGMNGDKGYFRTNIYHYCVPSENWVRIKLDLISNVNIDSKIKGFLILLKCLCINNTNLLNYNKSQIAKLLNIDIKTIRKYVKTCLKLQLIEQTNDGYCITNKSILEDYKIPKVQFEWMKHHIDCYRTIVEFCARNGLFIPRFDDHIAMKFIITLDEEAMVEKLTANIEKFKDCRYLTLKYIAKTLGVNTDKNERNKAACDIIIK